MSSRTDVAGIAAARKMLEERAAAKAARRAAEDAKWAEYKRQLALSTPHQGGAVHRRRPRAWRAFR